MTSPTNIRYNPSSGKLIFPGMKDSTSLSPLNGPRNVNRGPKVGSQDKGAGGGPPPVASDLIVIVAGQSNARSAGVATDGSDLPSNLDALGTDTLIKIWTPTNPTTSRAVGAFAQYDPINNSEPANPGVFSAPDRWGSEAEFVRRKRASGFTGNIWIIKEAINGIQLAYSASVNNWHPTGNANQQYKLLKAQTDAAKAVLTDAIWNAADKVLIWTQGEADAYGTDGILANAYEANLTTLFSSFRTDMLGSSGMIICERIRPCDYNTTQGGSTIYYAGGHIVRAAEKAVCAADGSGKTRLVNCDYLDLVNIHPTGPWVVAKGAESFLTYAGTPAYNINDTTPNAFAFTDVTGANVSSTVTSDVVTVTGILSAASISITGGQYRIFEVDGVTLWQDWTNSPSTVACEGQKVQVRQTSSGSALTQTDVVLTIGGVSDTWSVTTNSGAVVRHARTTALDNAQTAAGGANYGSTKLDALDAFFAGGVVDGFISSDEGTTPSLVRRLFIFGSQDETAARLNLTDPTATATKNGTLTWSAALGYDDGSGASNMRLNIAPSSAVPTDEFGMGMYVSETPNADAAYDMQGYSSAGTAVAPNFRIVNSSARANLNGSANITITSASSAKGFRHCQRISSTQIKFYQPSGALDGAVQASASAASTADNIRTPTGTRSLSAVWVTEFSDGTRSFDDAMVQKFRDRLVTLLTAFGSA